MANFPEQRTALNAFPDLPWSACLILAVEVDLTYCMRDRSDECIPRTTNRQIPSFLMHSKPCWLEPTFLFTCADKASDLVIEAAGDALGLQKLYSIRQRYVLCCSYDERSI